MFESLFLPVALGLLCLLGYRWFRQTTAIVEASRSRRLKRHIDWITPQRRERRRRRAHLRLH